jgi:hypothetical protein
MKVSFSFRLTAARSFSPEAVYKDLLLGSTRGGLINGALTLRNSYF